MTESLESLPFGGGWAEQPYWIVQALSVLRNEQQLWDNEQAEKARKEKAK